MTTQEILTKFRTFLLTEQCVSHNTYKSYGLDLEQFEAFLNIEKVELAAINGEILQKFLYHLYRLKLAGRSVARKVSTLKALFLYMNTRLGLVDLRAYLLVPKVSHKLPHYLTTQEIEKLLETAAQMPCVNAYRNRILVLLLYVSGMRISELVMLKISDLDDNLSAIKVNGKGGKQRIIPLPREIFTTILDYVNTARDKQRINNELVTDYLFPVIYGKKITHISRQACWQLLNRMWAATGSDKSISPHQLRHSLATHMLAGGVDLRSLQLILGHEHLATVQIYTHLDTSFLRGIYDKKHPRS